MDNYQTEMTSSAAPPFELANADAGQPEVAAAWRRLFDLGESPEKIYQSPAFYQSLEETGSGELLVVRHRASKAICGVIPVRKHRAQLEFRLGSFVLFSKHVTTCQVLGSIPLLEPDVPGLLEFVTGALLDRCADSRAVFMQAVPREWQHRIDTVGQLSSYALHGWRDCHTMPLPPDFSSYLQKLSAKKRYNLARQVRLLSEQAGTAQAVRIETPPQVAQLMAALRSLMTPEKLAVHGRQDVFMQLAAQGLLHAYIIRCGDRAVAAVLGTRSDKVWHVHHICQDSQYLHLSIGTTAMQLALADVLDHFSFSHIDFGYGTPRQEFRTTHVLQSRAQILLYRKGSVASLLFCVHRWYDRANEGLIRLAKKAGDAYKKTRLTRKGLLRG